jgi:hypothetical protein
VGGGIEAARQYAATGRIEDWGRVSAAAAGGAVAGAIQTALPGTGTVAMLAVGAGSGAAGGLAQRLVATGGKSAGTLSDVVVDATVGGATAGVLRGASVALRNVSARSPAASGRVLGSEAAFRRQYGELGRGVRGEGPINITDRGLAHVLRRHVIGGSETSGKSLFAADQDVASLIRQAGSSTPSIQTRGRLAFKVDAGRIIGRDRLTGEGTSTYTVITDANRNLITAFPGVPEVK